MKIGLNATCLNNRPSGAKQRFVGIYSEVAKSLPESEFVIYEPTDCSVKKWFEDLDNITARKTPIQSEGRFERLFGGLRYWPSQLAQDKLDFFEGFHLPLIRSPTGQTLLTIHDIRGIKSEAGVITRSIYRTILANSIKKADRIITVSEAMKTELLEHCPNIPISVIYNGIDAGGFESLTNLDLLQVSKKLALPNDFILSVGHFEERKNYLRLIEALDLLSKSGSSCSLVIVGNDSGERTLLESKIKSLNLSGQVQILSGLSDHEVRCVYKLSSLFVFPSSYEGFGIPILEAMAAGRPMVLSDIAVFREITEDQGVYFAYDDVEQMASAIGKVLNSSMEQEQIVRYGKERVKEFSFKNIAKEVVGIYKD